MIFNDLPWKWTEIILSFLRLHPSTAFQTLSLTMMATLFLLLPTVVDIMVIWVKFTHFSPFQFSSVAQSCPTFCDTMDCSTPGLPVHHQLLEFTQTHVHWVGDAIRPSYSPRVPFSSCPQSFLASKSFQMSQLFTSGSQSIGVSASASVLPMNTQEWSPLGWTGLISLL